ncbi:MAG: dCTP deaminase [Planctomycetia bacterium]|nr:dCTP deaminase [Planctomycetia bacterium]
MILSNTAVRDAMAAGLVAFDPPPEPLLPEPGRECPYQTSAVDLRLGEEVSWFKVDRAFTIDLRRGGFIPTFSDNSDSVRITEEQPYLLRPGKLVLAQTLETVDLPLREGRSLAARIEGRSSYARCGMLVHFTAPTIHAGYRGKITLEIINFGPYSINLFPKMPICQLIIEEVCGLPVRNDSQFQDQKRPGGAKA